MITTHIVVLHSKGQTSILRKKKMKFNSNNNMASMMGLLFCTCFVTLTLMNGGGVVTATRVFRVGDEFGWQQPGANDTSLYSLWATRNRFQVGDSLSFAYTNDSVIEVDKWGYYHCDSSSPVAAFNNGKGLFQLDRPGPFYFISGTPEHCRNGQRLLVEVMGLHHHSWHSPPSFAGSPDLAPSPQRSSGGLLLITLSSAFVVLITTFVALVWCAP